MPLGLTLGATLDSYTYMYTNVDMIRASQTIMIAYGIRALNIRAHGVIVVGFCVPAPEHTCQDVNNPYAGMRINQPNFLFVSITDNRSSNSN